MVGKHGKAQIGETLKNAESEQRARDVRRENGVLRYTIYKWKAKYGGMDVREKRQE